tara:strand:+ start:13776 stop:14282 length:507 start_codon:yes stop_codon:yes gene_type:complete
MPKTLPPQIKLEAMKLYLEGQTAAHIAETLISKHNVKMNPSTVYAWAKSGKWGENKALARANAVEKIQESETQRYARLQEEHLSTYETLRKKAGAELNTHMFDRAFDAAKALDIGIKGERTVIEGMINLQFIQDVMDVIVEEIQDPEALKRVAFKLKTLVQFHDVSNT